MKTNAKRHPIYFDDKRGHACVRLRTANRTEHVVLDAEAYDALMEAGVSRHWALNSNGQGKCYVKAGTANNNRVVARLITKAAAGEQVEYLDSNPLNLRRSNLRVVRGGHATVDCAELLNHHQEEL